MAMLKSNGIDVVFDVGANNGQFGQLLRSLGYRGRIVSFEPLSAVWGKLAKTCRKDPLWTAADRAALGSEDGEIEINVSRMTGSSSALQMLKIHTDVAPGSDYIGKERSPLRRLDSVGTQYLREDSRLFIKIDTQGFEPEVLKGATRLLDRTVGLLLELSLIPLYKDQSLYDEMIHSVKTMGFDMWAISPGISDPCTGRLLQADATFFRR
jgi:FkbM family methyltransferase